MQVAVDVVVGYTTATNIYYLLLFIIWSAIIANNIMNSGSNVNSGK